MDYRIKSEEAFSQFLDQLKTAQEQAQQDFDEAMRKMDESIQNIDRDFGPVEDE